MQAGSYVEYTRESDYGPDFHRARRPIQSEKLLKRHDVSFTKTHSYYGDLDLDVG